MDGNKLGVYGDSWADLAPFRYTDTILPWPMWVGKFLPAEIKSHATSGTGLWWSFEHFLSTYKKYDKIIFVYTNYNRWNGLTGHARSMAHLFEKDQLKYVEKKFRDLGETLIDVHPILFNESLNKFIYQKIFDEVNKLCYNYEIELVNVLPFDEDSPYIDISNMKGSVLYNLIEIMYKESSKSEKLREHLKNYNDIRHCHMNPHNNKVFAEMVFKSFGTNTVCNVGKRPEFIFDDKNFDYFEDMFNNAEK